MSRTGKPRHVHADLGDEHPRDGLTDPGDRRQPLGGLAKRAQHLVGLLLQFLHGGAQRVDLPQVQLQQETVVRRHPAVHRGDDDPLRSAFRRPVVQSASRSGSVSPAMSAARMPPGR